jgi:hypothetical protein
MSTRDLSRTARRAGAIGGEFLFVTTVLFAALGIAVMMLGGPGPLRSTGGIAFFVIAGAIALMHHFWYARHRDEIESSPEQKARRERRGF